MHRGLAEAHVIVRTALLVTLAAFGFVLCGAPHLIPDDRPRAAARTEAIVPASVRAPVAVPVEDDGDDTVDLYGNTVNDAVAKYKLDATGSLYELHSPQTEVPRLGSPRG